MQFIQGSSVQGVRWHCFHSSHYHVVIRSSRLSTTEWRKTINAHPVHTGSTHTVHSIKTQPSTESYLEHYSKQDIKKLKKT